MPDTQDDKNKNPSRTPDKQDQGQVREPQRSGGQQPTKDPNMGDQSKDKGQQR